MKVCISFCIIINPYQLLHIQVYACMQVGKKVHTFGSQFFRHLSRHGYGAVDRWSRDVSYIKNIKAYIA